MTRRNGSEANCTSASTSRLLLASCSEGLVATATVVTELLLTIASY